MNYKQAMDYVFGFTDYEKMAGVAYQEENFDLKRMESLLKRIDNPHLSAKTVHIAGTKGKGSTGIMVATALSASGYSTGLFTSPHLLTLRERFKIDGDLINEQEFTDLIEELKPHVDHTDKQKNHGNMTSFEILTVAAFSFFQKNKVEFQVMEVGLGGRLDATNVVEPEVCIITPISLDHTDILGDTLEKIAQEKAGIIKNGATVVSGPQPEEVMEVIEETCKKKKAELIKVGIDVTWQLRKANMRSQYFQVTTKICTYNLVIPLLGEHQLENAATAVAALEVLSEKYPAVTPQSIATGLARVYWQGRLQILLRRPLVVVDGAHNGDSMRRLKEALAKSFRYQKMVLIIGASSDKDIRGMVEEMASLADTVVVTRSQHPRSMEVDKLEKEFRSYRIEPQIEENIPDALKYALSVAELGDLILVTGSLFVVAEVIANLEGVPLE
ncbi:bifunctional folylpolyglutamate synthase/dihydrofolate synthase [Chloroflexota bacterium]